MIQVHSLTVQVPGFTLRDVSFEVPAGGLGIVTGPTGAGKTTLVEAIAGVRRAMSGAVALHGVDVSALPPEGRDVGLVYQAGWLFPHLTVRENVAYGARQERSVAAVVEALQLATLFDKPVRTLSGGERQLVALARALAREPRTLLLDEPFAAMDSALRGRIRETVLSHASARGMTTLLVTHDPTEAAREGSVALRVEGGTLRRLP
jgi:ABC-type sulfate/molybdate transport systems ATPase subunit